MKQGKRIKKSLLSILLAFIMVAGTLSVLPGMTMHVYADSPKIYVCGVDVSNGGTVYDTDDGTAKYDPDTNVLTLTDFKYTSQSSDVIDAYRTDLKIKLYGKNELSGSQSDSWGCHAIYVGGKLTICGDGSLTINSGKSSVNYSIGIQCNELELTDKCTVTANSGEAVADSYGIHCNGAIKVSDNCTVTANSGEAVDSSYGIQCNGAIKVSKNCTVTANGGKGTGSYGIYSGGDITVDGELTASSDEDVTDFSEGIYCLSNITVNGKVDATSGKANQSFGIDAKNIDVNKYAVVNAKANNSTNNSVGISYGIYVEENIIVNGGVVNATCGTAYNSNGICAYGNIQVISGDVTAYSSDGNAILGNLDATGATIKAGDSESNATEVTNDEWEISNYVYIHNVGFLISKNVTGNGDVSVLVDTQETSNALVNTTVNLSVKKGNLQSISVTTASDNSVVQLNEVEEGKRYSFKMPADAVTVKAVFDPYKLTLNQNYDGCSPKSIFIDEVDFKESVKSAANSMVQNPPVGYYFGGWYEKDATTGELKTTEFDFDNFDTSTMTDDVTVYAKWVRLKANVTKAPVANILTYNGSAQTLVSAGEAQGGEMQYALGNETVATSSYSSNIPTETNAGTYYVWYKAVGTNNNDDSESDKVVVVINECPHTRTEIRDDEEASCEKDGYTGDKYCLDCGEKLETGKTIDGGHKYGEPKYVWSEDGKSCVATAICSNNTTHKLSEEATITSKVKTPPTSTEKGTTTYTASFKNDLFKTQTKDIDDIPVEESDSGDDIDTTVTDQVKEQINLLPSTDNITTADKEAIEAARAAYENLTDKERAEVGYDTYKKLTDAEAALKAAEEGNKDSENGSGNNSGSGNGSGSGSGSGGSSYSSEWVNGKWYNADGTQTYEPTLSWKSNSTGWWVEDTNGWYPVGTWQKIDGYWYYFNADGYMASNEWRDGYWLGSSGAWTYQYTGSWKHSSKGWWFEDTSGWYPKSQWVKIDSKWYYFGKDGIMYTNRRVDGYWVGSDGSCQ